MVQIGLYTLLCSQLQRNRILFLWSTKVGSTFNPPKWFWCTMFNLSQWINFLSKFVQWVRNDENLVRKIK